MEGSSRLLLHFVSLAEETMTLFLSGFKHFHGALPGGPHQWPPQPGTGKVSLDISSQLVRRRCFALAGMNPLNSGD
jgi:hypothetical protein